tara:strand:+ start:218 stop:796 length:579 start_codon:yes stop_codon:yes gene_type:complete
MKKLTLILLVTIWFPLTAQNLLPNPGFEDIIECPPAYPGNTKIHFAEPWIPVLSVDNSTSDLWHECVFEPGNDPWGQLEFYGHYYPENLPHSGLSRAFIAVYSLNGNNKREYIQVPLLESLFVGQEYYVKIYIKNELSCSIAIDNIGALFTTECLNYNNIFPLYLPNTWTPGDDQMNELYPQVKCDNIFTAQ